MPTPLLDPVTLRWLADECAAEGSSLADLAERWREKRDERKADGYIGMANSANEARLSLMARSVDERNKAKRLRALATRMERRIAAGEVRDDATT